jgi:hypothetical protein
MIELENGEILKEKMIRGSDEYGNDVFNAEMVCVL